MENQPQPQSQPQSQPQPQPQQRRRRRPALSCRECRRRKIKCDHSNPCAPCLRHKTRCVYKPYTEDFDDIPLSATTQQHDSPASSLHQTASPPPPSDSSAPRQLTQAGDGDSRNIDRSISVTLQDSNSSTPWVTVNAPAAAPAPAAPAAQPVTISAVFGRNDLRQGLPDQDPDGGTNLRELLYRIQKLEESSAGGSRIGDSPLQGADARSEFSVVSQPRQPPTGMQEWQAVLNKSRDWGRSRWRGAASEFTAIIACYGEIMGQSSKDSSFQSPEASALIAEATDFLRKCKNRARSIKTGRPTRGLPSPGFGLAPLSREVADVMANLYLTSFESTCVSTSCENAEPC